MNTLKVLLTSLLLFPATTAYGAAETKWPGPSLAALLGVAIVVFVLIRWRSKP